MLAISHYTTRKIVTLALGTVSCVLCPISFSLPHFSMVNNGSGIPQFIVIFTGGLWISHIKQAFSSDQPRMYSLPQLPYYFRHTYNL